MTYAMGTSERERRRLEIQARLLDPYTRRLLGEAGVQQGSSVLDIGTGAGDVALMIAELVGPSGSVVAVDIEPAMIAHAQARATAAGFGHVRFEVTAGLLAEVADRYDVVFARLVLMHQSDKSALLRRAAELVKPGGTLAIIDSAWNLPAFWSCPTIESYDRYLDDTIATAERFGNDSKVGSKLVALFAEVGLAEPRLSAELVTGGKGTGIAEYNLMNGDVWFERARLASLPSPTVEQHIARRDEIMQAVEAGNSQFFGPCLIGALLTL